MKSQQNRIVLLTRPGQNSEGDHLAFILDEGFTVTQGIVPGTGSNQIVMFGVTEKGYASLELEVATVDQGHSSIPPKETPIGILAEAVHKLERQGQPSRFGASVEAETLKYAAARTSFGLRMVFANMWLFSGSTDIVTK